MLAEMIEKIASLAKSGVEAKNKFSVIPDLTGDGQYEIYPDGSVTHSEWPAERQTQNLSSISEIGRWFDQFEAGPNRQICVSGFSVQATTNSHPSTVKEQDAAETASVDFRRTNEIELLGVNFTNLELARHLRLTWSNCLEPDVLNSLYRVLTNLDFNQNSQERSASNATSRDSMGKSVTSEIVSTEGDLIEFQRLTFMIRPFTDQEAAGFRFPIVCYLESNFRERTFKFAPVAQDFNDCLDNAIEGIAEFLGSECPEIPVLKTA